MKSTLEREVAEGLCSEAPRLRGVGESLRVRDLTGEIDAPASPRPVVVTPARRGGKMTLCWYDYLVLAIVFSSLAAGIVCLLRGV